MKKLLIACILIITGFILYWANFRIGSEANVAIDKIQSQSSQVKVQANFGKIPMHFEPNQGQMDDEVKFLSRGSGYTLFLTSNEAVLSLRKHEIENRESKPKLRTEEIVSENQQSEIFTPLDDSISNGATRKSTTLRMKLVGANPEPQVNGVDELPGKSNYFIGNDPKKWSTNVTNYAKVKYKGVYPGIDLVYYGNQQQLEYDFVVTPGADPEAITLAFEAANDVNIDDEGNLILLAGAGEITLRHLGTK